MPAVLGCRNVRRPTAVPQLEVAALDPIKRRCRRGVERPHVVPQKPARIVGPEQDLAAEPYGRTTRNASRRAHERAAARATAERIPARSPGWPGACSQ